MAYKNVYIARLMNYRLKQPIKNSHHCKEIALNVLRMYDRGTAIINHLIIPAPLYPYISHPIFHSLLAIYFQKSKSQIAVRYVSVEADGLNLSVPLF